MSCDFDPRDADSRERDDGIRDGEDEWLTLGCGPSAGVARAGDEEVRDRADDWREERDRESRDRNDERGLDPRDVFLRDVDLPRGHERELVHDRDRDYTLNGSESAVLANVGAFRVVSERDLRDPRDEAFGLRHLEDQGLIQRVPLNEHERAITLTDEGRGLLERHRGAHSEHRQAFYAGADKARERTHDAQLYRAYLKAAEGLRARDARILRVELDRELKREYQRFLRARNHSDRDSSGRPNRTPVEVEQWAHAHELPYFDEQAHFPDVRVEYEDLDGEIRHLDLELTTEHYRGAHGAAARRSGFAIHSSGGGRGGGRSFDPRAAEEFL
jgi:DNA-binding MarR family transcriptional regulator